MPHCPGAGPASCHRRSRSGPCCIPHDRYCVTSSPAHRRQDALGSVPAGVFFQVCTLPRSAVEDPQRAAAQQRRGTVQAGVPNAGWFAPGSKAGNVGGVSISGLPQPASWWTAAARGGQPEAPQRARRRPGGAAISAACRRTRPTQPARVARDDRQSTMLQMMSLHLQRSCTVAACPASSHASTCSEKARAD